MIKAKFLATTGSQTGTGNSNEADSNTVKLDVDVLEGLYKESIPFTNKLPSGGISLNYTIKQSLEKEILSTRFMVGPVPIKISAGFGGEAGFEMSGSADIISRSVTGSIRPYLNSKFIASGGVDAVIAYATLNAKLDPLLNIEMPVTFNSANASKLSFNGSVKALYGKIYLKVGFYYPCPDIEKIVGWLSGDEDIPLCECNWEFNIFDFPGLDHKWSY